MDRGYDKETVKNQIRRVDAVSREDLLTKRNNDNRDDRNTLVLTYHPAFRNAWKILKEAHKVLHLSAKLKKLSPVTPRIAFRNPRSIQDTLVHSELDKLMGSQRKGNFSCLNSRCNIHKKYLQLTSTTFTRSVTKKQYPIKGDFDCNSECIVYLITCSTCEKQYVGSTTTRCRDRFNQYISGIQRFGSGVRGLSQENLFEHFHSDSHNGHCDQIKLQIIDRCYPNNQELRESYWSFHLKTVAPFDLNDYLPLPKKLKVNQRKSISGGVLLAPT